jgi:hypothetical protein
MFIQTLLIGVGTLVALTAIVWSMMPFRHIEPSFVS